jgi:beta-lactam-binding protein with PASTA domain
MAKIVDIIPTDTRAKCVAGESCSIDFSFTNTTGRKARVGGKVVAGNKEQEQWFKVKGGPEWDLDPNATDKLTVTAQIPKDAKPETYTLQVMMFDVAQPEDYFDMSPTVRIDVGAATVAPTPEPKGFPWWILVAVVGVLLIAGVAAWLLWPRSVSVPAVVGMKAEQATATLEQASLSVAKVTEISNAPPDEVIRQEPAADTEVKKNSQVVIYVAGQEAMVDVPNVIKIPFADAERMLAASQLKAVRKEPPRATLEFQPGEVVAQSPAFGSQVKPGSVVTLEVAGPSVKVPDVKGRTLPDALTRMAEAQLLVQVTGDQSKLSEKVTGTTPSENTVVLKGSQVKVHMPGGFVIIPLDRLRIEPLIMQKVPLPILRQVTPESEAPAPEDKK